MSLAWRPKMEPYQALLLASTPYTGSQRVKAKDVGRRSHRGFKPSMVIIDELPLHQLRFEAVGGNYWPPQTITLDVALDPVSAVARMRPVTEADVLELRKRLQPHHPLGRCEGERPVGAGVGSAAGGAHGVPIY